MTRGRWLVAVVLLATVTAGAFWMLLPHRRNVILITIDTLRADRLSAYGYAKHRTPHLDRLAAEGALYENAFCDVTWTTPSMASVMTGQYATRHGMRSSFQTLKPEATTLAEILRDHEMNTAAIIASYPLHSVFGLSQGFGLYDEEFNSPLAVDPAVEFGPQPSRPTPATPPSDDTKAMRWFLMAKALGDAYRSDSDVSDRAIAWLRTERGDPFFLWIHYFGPHEKPTGLTGIETFAQEREIQLAAYDPDVVLADAQVGRVLDTLDELGLGRDTAVVVHADHGQSLTEHDYFGHGRDVYEPTFRIPLIVRAPWRIPPGRRDPDLARNVDILPTVLDLLGFPNPVVGDGASLLGMRTPSAYVETYLSATWLFSDVLDVQSDTRLGFRRLGIRTPRWKYVINDPVAIVDKDVPPPSAEIYRRHYAEELYDITVDPGETTNRIFEQKAVATQLRSEVFQYQAVGATVAETIKLDDAQRDRLRALGYLGD